MRETISIKLINTLLRSVNSLDPEALQRIAGFVATQQTPDGAFMDKSGQPDLYYTAFGFMLSAVLNVPLDLDKARQYLETQDVSSLDLIHYAAYTRCRMLCALPPLPLKQLEDFSSYPHGDPQSPYTQYIWLSLLEDAGGDAPQRGFDAAWCPPLEGVAFRPGEDGNPNNGTNTTNTTVATLAIQGQLEGYTDNLAVRHLWNLQHPSGGFAAAQASPVPDLLSTATSLFMLRCYGIEPKHPARDFIEAHWLESGGFSATLLEDKSDVEYTFYGLLALGAITK